MAQEQETQEQLMERIKKMSPEELLEFQKSRCIFCQIIGGKVQSKKMYDDSKSFAILDINPANPGHVLILPKEHYSIMPQVPESTIDHLGIVTKRLSQIALQAIGAKGTNILIQNGIAAGQKAQHFMIHLIPRKENDALPLVIDKKTISDNDYSVIRSRLKKRIYELVGKTEPADDLKKEEVKEVPQIEQIPQEDVIIEEPAQVPVPEEEEKEEEVVEEKQEEVKEVKEITYWTSAQAKRFHTQLCPFAQNIPKQNLIELTEKQAIDSGRRPCTCVTGKRIPFNKDDEKISKDLEKTNDEIEKIDKEIDNLNKDIDSKQEENEDNNKQDSTNLDDIAKLFGARK